MTYLAALGSTSLITSALNYCDNVADATDAAYTQRRTRYLQYLQEVVAEFWLEKEWSWSMRTATLAAISAAGQGSLPTSFLEVGRGGNLIDTATNLQLRAIDPSAMRLYLESDLGSNKEYIYSIYSGKDADPARYIYVPKGWSGVTTLSLFYRRIPPLCADGASDEISEIPASYQYLVLLPGLYAKAFRSLGNPEADVQDQKYARGVAKAVREDPGIQRDSVASIGGYGVARKMC